MATTFGNVTVTRVDSVKLTGTRPRVVGCNSQKGSHGRTLTDPIARLHTDAGIVGWGWADAPPAAAKLLLGRRLDSLFDPEAGTTPGYDLFDLPLWDLAGRVLGRPVHAMLGGHGQKRAPIYDGSIYMEDIDPETGKDLGLEPLRDVVHQGLSRGFEAFKMKIGRGARWMERARGFRRDIEAIRAVREILGPDRKLLVDGNNAYTPAEAAELVSAVRPLGIFWFEEPFEEDIETSGEFRRFLHAGQPGVLLADGEGTVPSQPKARSILRAAAIDVVQFDLRWCPVTPWKSILPLVEEAGLLAAPHNWASHLLNYYVPNVGRGIRRFCMAETDPSVIPEVDSSRYRMTGGMLEVPDAPGFGLELDQAAVDGLVREHGWSVAV